MSFNPDKSHTLTISLWKDHLKNPPINFLGSPLEEVQSFKLLGLTISHDLSWANHISKLASKGSHWQGILHLQRPSLTHLNSYPHARPSSAAWSTALPSGLAPLPRIKLSLMPWKPRPSRSLEYLVLKLSLWVYPFTIERWDENQLRAQYFKRLWKRCGSVTKISRFDYSSGPDPDPAYQCNTKRQLFSLVEVCALSSAVLDIFVFKLYIYVHCTCWRKADG